MTDDTRLSRRSFLQRSAAAGLILAPAERPAEAGRHVPPVERPAEAGRHVEPLDLSPARWIWYPSGRTLPNTFVLFRREFDVAAPPRRVTGWIAADSRYRLEVNGERVQWGPAPCDPRWLEADPVDVTALVRPGTNVLAVTVLHYGYGDGTWPAGKPGLIARLEIEHADGRVEAIVTDSAWRCLLCRAWPPGHYKRWFLRALQEEFDARLYPEGWQRSGYATAAWLPAMLLQCPASKPPVCSTYPDYAADTSGNPPGAALLRRSVPLLDERPVPAARLRETFRLRWRQPPEDYFDCVVPAAFEASPAGDAVRDEGAGAWSVALDGTHAVALTFDFAEQIVGWPSFTIDAPAGTSVEWLVQEAHRVGGPVLLNTHFHSWGRLRCAEKTTRFEAFDFESFRWLQLHVRGGAGRVVVREVGARRRQFPWPAPADPHVADPPLQRLLEACVNTLNNSAQETCVDGMARERQQYSGDGGHQLHAVHLAFGESRLPARFVRTFSQGLMASGFFLDSWPAYDRLARLSQREMGLSNWGPILDHGVGFVFDCHHHWMYTGQLEAVTEAYPRLLRFVDYLLAFRRDGLLAVEGIGIPTVWMDHQAYREPREKALAFNLYASAMLTHALAPLAEAMSDAPRAQHARAAGAELLRACIRRFWSESRGLFVNNLPWSSPGDLRCCDRSLATSILFDQCPAGRAGEAIRLLVEQPASLGLSYPANAPWRFWALARARRTDVIVGEWRRRWATMGSVIENNTVQEDWEAAPDSGAQWSHCAVGPLIALYSGIAGIRPTAPGFSRFEIEPQPADLAAVSLTARTVRGPIAFACRGTKGDRELELELPPDAEGTLVLDEREETRLPSAGRSRGGLRRHALPAGSRIALRLHQT